MPPNAPPEAPNERPPLPPAQEQEYRTHLERLGERGQLTSANIKELRAFIETNQAAMGRVRMLELSTRMRQHLLAQNQYLQQQTATEGLPSDQRLDYQLEFLSQRLTVALTQLEGQAKQKQEVEAVQRQYGWMFGGAAAAVGASLLFFRGIKNKLKVALVATLAFFGYGALRSPRAVAAPQGPPPETVRTLLDRIRTNQPVDFNDAMLEGVNILEAQYNNLRVRLDNNEMRIDPMTQSGRRYNRLRVGEHLYHLQNPGNGRAFGLLNLNGDLDGSADISSLQRQGAYFVLRAYGFPYYIHRNQMSTIINQLAGEHRDHAFTIRVVRNPNNPQNVVPFQLDFRAVQNNAIPANYLQHPTLSRTRPAVTRTEIPAPPAST